MSDGIMHKHAEVLYASGPSRRKHAGLLPGRQALVMRHVIQSKRPKVTADGRGSHGVRLHEVLLRREEMERSRIGSARVRKGR